MSSLNTISSEKLARLIGVWIKPVFICAAHLTGLLSLDVPANRALTDVAHGACIVKNAT